MWLTLVVVAAAVLVAQPRLRPRAVRTHWLIGGWLIGSWAKGGWGVAVADWVGRTTRTQLIRVLPSVARYRERTVGVALIVVIVATAVMPPLGLTLAMMAISTPVLRARRARRRWRRDLERGLPEVMDQLGLAVASGLSLHQALRISVGWFPPVYRELVGSVIEHNRVGVPLVDALRELARTIEPVGRRPLAVIIAAERDGTALAPSLARAADEARQHRQRQVELRARRLPVLLLLPLVSCVLPAFVLLTIVPLVASSLDGLRLVDL